MTLDDGVCDDGCAPLSSRISPACTGQLCPATYHPATIKGTNRKKTVNKIVLSIFEKQNRNHQSRGAKRSETLILSTKEVEIRGQANKRELIGYINYSVTICSYLQIKFARCFRLFALKLNKLFNGGESFDCGTPRWSI